MAIKVFNANLNGGDAVTPDNDLFYRIYGSADGYTTPIKTTGSNNTDANVTVTGDVVVITGVDVGLEDFFKISSVDEAGQESILSDAVGSFLFFDTFDGTDWAGNTKWTEVNLDPTVVQFSQNNALIMHSDGGTLVGSGDNQVTASASFTAPLLVMRVDFTKTDDSTSIPTFSYAMNFDVDNAVRLQNANSGDYTKLRMTIRVGGVNVLSEVLTADFNNSFKLVMTPTKVDIYVWSGSWALVKTDNNGITQSNLYLTALLGSTVTSPEQTVTIDNLYVTDYDYATLLPS